MGRIRSWFVLFAAISAGCQAPGSGTDLPPVDLVVTSIQAPSTSQTTSDTWILGATITNTGTDNAGSFTLLYQLSTKSVLDASATTIGTSTVTGLAAGGTYTDTWSTTYSIPQGGTHWIFVTADSTNAVVESNETNNTSSASVPIIYPRVVIETYDPNGSAFTSPFISLFGPSGDTTTDPIGAGPNEWNNDGPPFTVDTGVAIAESGTTGTWASIDYQGGLAPGVYYVRVRGAQSYQTGAYAIRFLSLNVGDSLPAYTTFATQNTADSPYESDDALVAGTGVPANPAAAAPGSVLNRSLQVSSDMDWFKLTLP